MTRKGGRKKKGGANASDETEETPSSGSQSQLSTPRSETTQPPSQQQESVTQVSSEPGRGRGRGRGRGAISKRDDESQRKEDKPGQSQAGSHPSQPSSARSEITSQQPPQAHRSSSDSYFEQSQSGGRGRGRGRGANRRNDESQKKKDKLGESQAGSPLDFGFGPALGELPQKPSAWGPPLQKPQSYQQRQETVSEPSFFAQHSSQSKPVQQPQQRHSKQQQQQRPQQPRQPQQQQPQQHQQQSQQAAPKQVADVQKTAEDLSKLSLKEQQTPTAASSPTLKISKQDANYMALSIPKRKDPFKAGTLGRRIQVLTNMMRINFGDKFKSRVIHYDVDIQPDKPKYLMRKVFSEAKKKLFPNREPAFDGKKNAFSAGLLPINSPVTTEVTVYNEDGREKKYNVTFKIANEIDLSWLPSVRPGMCDTERDQISLQALDVILRNAPALRYTAVGRSFFSPPQGSVVSLGGGMDLWVGLFQSAVLGWKPYLNVDVAHKGFPKPQSVIDLMKTLCGCDGRPQYGRGQQYGRGGPQQGYGELTVDLINRNREAIIRFLRTLKVTIEIPNQPTSRRTQRVIGLVECPRNNMFECEGRRISVENYYKMSKGYTIRHPLYPCLWVGSRDKNVHVPPEICTIVPGQVTQRRLDEEQTPIMIRHAATGTNDRKEKILSAFRALRINEDSCMREFDISVSGEFEKVDARVLEPPDLDYSNRTARVQRGVWRAEKFKTPSKEIKENNSWTILNLNPRTRDDELYRLQEELITKGSRVGLMIGRALTPFITMPFRGPHDMKKLMNYFEEQKSKNLKLVIVVLPDANNPYSKVKQISELRIGILTQCLKNRTVSRISDSTIGNILLKINAKLNGVNHSLSAPRSRPRCLQTPCMIVGADVTHPSPDSTDIPSIAAVAASHDPNAFKYNVEIRLQPPRQEIIGDLAEIMKIQLLYFLKVTGYKPDKIIFYRDGVSEGQFGQVLHEELRAIKEACKRVQKDSYEPKITFLVVQKRHHVRLFPTHTDNSDDKNYNVQAGTIVDTEITHPTHIDFYLVSHASIQGTARPTKYRCLWDDNNMTEDEIERLTYFLCHMFSRCTRSVSYPTPTYYAHLAAFRAKNLTQDVPIDLTQLPREQATKLTVKQEVLKELPMFFV